MSRSVWEGSTQRLRGRPSPLYHVTLSNTLSFPGTVFPKKGLELDLCLLPTSEGL